MFNFNVGAWCCFLLYLRHLVARRPSRQPAQQIWSLQCRSYEKSTEWAVVFWATASKSHCQSFRLYTIYVSSWTLSDTIRCPNISDWVPQYRYCNGTIGMTACTFTNYFFWETTISTVYIMTKGVKASTRGRRKVW